MNPTILGVIGPGFLNQVPTLPCPALCAHDGSRFSSSDFATLRAIIMISELAHVHHGDAHPRR